MPTVDQLQTILAQYWPLAAGAAAVAYLWRDKIVGFLWTPGEAAVDPTLERIAAEVDVPRREVEAAIETGLHRLPWVLVSGPRGYYIPADAADVNRYLASLRSRAVKMFLRARTVRRKALADGFVRQGRDFANPPSPQRELFA